MEVLTVLSKADVVALEERFIGRNGEGLEVDEFVAVFRALLDSKNMPDVSLRWNNAELEMLFQEVDYNGDTSVSFEEFTSFAISTALHRSTAVSKELPFKNYLQAPMPFAGQSHHLRNLLYLPFCDKAVACGYTKTSVHDTNTGRVVALLPNRGTLLSAVYSIHAGMYCICNDQNQLLFVEDPPPGTPPTAVLQPKYSLTCDRAATHLALLPRAQRVVAGDREGTLRTLSLDRLRLLQQSQPRLRDVTVREVRLFDDDITALLNFPQSPNPSTLLAASMGSPIVKVYDAEAGETLLSIPSGHDKYVRHAAFCDTHRLLVTSGGESHLTAFAVDQVQAVPFELRDLQSPHIHRVCGVSCVSGTHQILSADVSGTVKLWDARQLQCVTTFNLPRTSDNNANPLSGIRYDHKNQRFISLAKETMCFEYDQRVTAVLAHEEPIVGVLYNKVTDTVLSCTGHEIKLWGVSNGTAVSRRTDVLGKTEEVTCTTLDCVNGRTVIVGTSDGHVAALLCNTGAELWRVSVLPPGVSRHSSGARVLWVHTMAKSDYIVGLAAGHVFLCSDNRRGGFDQVLLTHKSLGIGPSAYGHNTEVLLFTTNERRHSLFAIDLRSRAMVSVLGSGDDEPEDPGVPELTSIVWVVDGIPPGATNTSVLSPGASHSRRASVAMPSAVLAVEAANELRQYRAGVSIFAVSDTTGAVTLFTIKCGNLYDLEYRQRIVRLRPPKKMTTSALTPVTSRYLVAGTERGAICVWDLQQVLLQLVLRLPSHATPGDVEDAIAAAVVEKPARHCFNAEGQDCIGLLEPVPDAFAVIAATAESDVVVKIWSLSGENLGALCRGRGSMGSEDLGSSSRYDFPVYRERLRKGQRETTAPDVERTDLGSVLFSRSAILPVVPTPASTEVPTDGDEDESALLVVREEGGAEDRRSKLKRVAAVATMISKVDEAIKAKRRRKRVRHVQRHAHDSDIIPVPALDSAQPGFLRDLILSDRTVALHHGVARASASPESAHFDLSLGASTTARQRRGKPLAVPDDASAKTPQTSRCPGILKPGGEKDRRRMFLDELRAAAQRSHQGAGLTAMLDQQLAEVAASPLPATPASSVGLGAPAGMGVSADLPMFNVTSAPEDMSSRPDTCGSGAPRPVLTVDDVDGINDARVASPTFVDISSGLLQERDVAAAKRKSASFAGKLEESVIAVPMPPPPAPARARGQAFRRVQGIDAVVPAGVALPVIPHVGTTAPGWQQLQREDSSASGLRTEVSVRGADAAMNKQYYDELAAFNADRERWKKERHVKTTARTKFKTMDSEDAKNHLSRGRLDKGKEKKEVATGASVEVDFETTKWERRRTRLPAALASLTGRRK